MKNEMLMIDSVQHYPEWHNKPLHLTIEEMASPHKVLTNYFESFHLGEARSIVEEWLVEVISSRRSNCERNRNNTMHFCKYLLKLIEAAWIINGNAGNYDTAIGGETTVNEQDKKTLGKKKRLIEYANENPLYVIDEVCNATGVEEFCNRLLQWLNIALINDEFYYTSSEPRSYLMAFHNELTIFLKDLFAFNDTLEKTTKLDNQQADNEKKSKVNNTVKIQKCDHNNIKLKSINFFEKFQITYVRREIADWFFAAIIYDGNCPVNLTKLQIYVAWEWVSCLTEAAWAFSRLQSKTASSLES